MLVPDITASAAAGSAPAGAHFFETDGGRIAYDDTGGDGPLVVCVPGLGDLRQEYRFLAPALAGAGFRVVAMDLRGHGDSGSFARVTPEDVGKDVVALVKHLGAGRARLVGTSMAAGSVAYAAALAPDLVERVVMIGPAVRDVPPSAFLKLAMKLLFGGPWRASAWLLYVGSLYPTKKPPDWPAYRAKLHAAVVGRRFEAVKKLIDAPKAEVERHLGEVKAPVLVVMGTKDRDFQDPPAEAALVAGRVHGKVELVDGAGHYPHVEMPEVTAPLVEAFLR